MDTKQPQPSPQDKARGLVLLALMSENKLSLLPAEAFKIFKTKPFQEWPLEMQDSLRPFGAKMIS